VSGIAAYFSSFYNPYFLDVAITCGINITLAVSLNLINGYTGQFSLGHAGFMAVGAYAAAMLTTTLGDVLLPLVGGQSWMVFVLALYAGGLAALAGLIVGAPSLDSGRLSGDRDARFREPPRHPAEHRCGWRLARADRHSGLH
jgi:branched-chain amino acid transport system permease protein